MADTVKQQSTEELLAERGKTHGEYADHARCTQAILRAMQVEKNWPSLSDIQKETVHMIAHKLGRIATGNPDIADHYDDIAGYAKLVSQRLETPVRPFAADRDFYHTLAVAWSCSRNEAKTRFLAAAHEQGLTAAQAESDRGLSPAQEQMKRAILSDGNLRG